MKIRGTNKADFLNGTAESDTMLGRGAGDQVFGQTGDDMIKGGRGNDRLYGGDGDDVIRGGKGDDKIYGGAGDNILSGGKGADTFYVSLDGFDDIRDFQHGKDRVVILDPDVSLGYPIPSADYGYSGNMLSYKGSIVAHVDHISIDDVWVI